MRSYSSLSRDWIRVAVQSATDPTSSAVYLAFTTPTTKPAAGDWVTAAWESAALSTGEWVARCTIGPGGTKTLPVGEYTVWVKITDVSTVPVIPLSTITIT